MSRVHGGGSSTVDKFKHWVCGVGEKIAFNYTKMGKCRVQKLGDGCGDGGNGRDAISSSLQQDTPGPHYPHSICLRIRGYLETLDGNTVKYSCLSTFKRNAGCLKVSCSTGGVFLSPPFNLSSFLWKTRTHKPPAFTVT